MTMETTTSETSKMETNTEMESTTIQMEKCTVDSSRMIRLMEMALRLFLTEPRRLASGRMKYSWAR